MNKITTAALAIAAFALAPLTAFASADEEQIENYCNQEAKEKGVPAEKVADYIANCVATNLKAEKEVEGEEEKSE
jgi:DNA polymerase III delta subunit